MKSQHSTTIEKKGGINKDRQRSDSYEKKRTDNDRHRWKKKESTERQCQINNYAI